MKKKQIINYPEVLCEDFSRDKYGHRYCIAKCPHCYNFLQTREDTLKSKNVKSCGCLKCSSTPNVYYFPLGCDYVVGYYDNTDGIFIFDVDKYDIISQYHWTDKNANARHEPVTDINGKTTSMARLLLNTPEGLESEHINRIPSDNRMCNLRIATRVENSQNKENTKDNAKYGSFSFSKSQEIARNIETNQFNNSFQFCGGVLETVDNLPEKNVFKTRLRSICRDKLNGVLSEDDMNMQLFRLLNDYKTYSQNNVR